MTPAQARRATLAAIAAAEPSPQPDEAVSVALLLSAGWTQATAQVRGMLTIVTGTDAAGRVHSAAGSDGDALIAALLEIA